MKPLIFHNLTMDTFMQAVSGYRLETHTCVCSARLTSNNIIIAQYSHYFPETMLDFQAEVTAGSDFVTFYRMDMAGERALIRGTPDFRFMFDTFGRVMSSREVWKYAISSALETRTIQLFNVEKGFTIVAIPGSNQHARVNMREIVGPDWPGDAALVLRLADFQGGESPFDDAYPTWMPEYADDIASGHIDAAAILDQTRIIALFKKILTKDDMDFTVKGDCLVINRKPFKATLSIKDVAREAAFTAKSFHDIIETRLDIALNRIYSAENLISAIRKDMPSYTYAIDGDFLEIANPHNGLSDRVNLYTPLPHNGAKLIISRLREALCKDENSAGLQMRQGLLRVQVYRACCLAERNAELVQLRLRGKGARNCPLFHFLWRAYGPGHEDRPGDVAHRPERAGCIVRRCAGHAPDQRRGARRQVREGPDRRRDKQQGLRHHDAPVFRQGTAGCTQG